MHIYEHHTRNTMFIKVVDDNTKRYVLKKMITLLLLHMSASTSTHSASATIGTFTFTYTERSITHI